jgi:solute carrier family 20 (sodium-dependent phosphate transporter)
VLLIGSFTHMPLSSTHCFVGAIIGVSTLDGQGALNWLVVSRCVTSWVATLAFCGVTTAALFAQGIYAPHAL